MPTPELRFRAATEDDLDRILEIHLAAYPDPRGGEERLRNFTASRFGALEDLVLCERGGDIVGQAFLFPLEAWFGARGVPIGAIASLAVAPEARGQRIATALLERLHRASDARGDALTMLYAFRQGMYAKLGYGPCASRRRLAFDPASIPDVWRALARSLVHRASGGDQEAVRAAYARAAARTSGWLTRTDAMWARHFARERRQFLVTRPRESGAVTGYVAFELKQDEPHMAVSLVVDEIAADDDVSRRALLGALGAMRDQVAEIELEIDSADPLELALCDADRRRFGTDAVEHELGTVVGGPMVRVEDVTRAIEARGYDAEGTLDVIVHDVHDVHGVLDTPGAAVGEDSAVSICVKDGRAEVSAARAASAAIRTTRATLASLLYGGLRASDAARLGLAEADRRTLSRADALLALAPPSPVDPF